MKNQIILVVLMFFCTFLDFSTAYCVENPKTSNSNKENGLYGKKNGGNQQYFSLNMALNTYRGGGNSCRKVFSSAIQKGTIRGNNRGEYEAVAPKNMRVPVENVKRFMVKNNYICLSSFTTKTGLRFGFYTDLFISVKFIPKWNLGSYIADLPHTGLRVGTMAFSFSDKGQSFDKLMWSGTVNRNGTIEGYGTGYFQLNDGTCYVIKGNFRNGMLSGDGTLTIAKPDIKDNVLNSVNKKTYDLEVNADGTVNAYLRVGPRVTVNEKRVIALATIIASVAGVVDGIQQSRDQQRAEAENVLEKDGVKLILNGSETYGAMAMAHCNLMIKNTNSYDVYVEVEIYLCRMSSCFWTDTYITYHDKHTDIYKGIYDENSEKILVKANSTRNVDLVGKKGHGRPSHVRITSVRRSY